MRPIETDRRFEEIHHLFASALPRLAIVALADFLRDLGPHGGQAAAYLPEAAQLLEGHSEEIDLSGLPPDRLWPVVDHVLPLVERAGMAPAMGFRLSLAIPCVFAGRFDLVSRLLLLEAPLPDPEAPITEGTQALQHVQKILADYRVSQRLETDRLEQLIDRVTPFVERGRRMVFVPVVERPFRGAVPETGRLRGLFVDLFARSSTGEDRIATDVSGSEDEGPGQATRRVLTAGRALLGQTHPALAAYRYSARIGFQHARQVHAGSSADLLLTCLWYESAVELGRPRRRIETRHGVAFTGAIGQGGDVLPVEAGSLPLKIEAVFFSPLATLALPGRQLDAAEVYLEQLHRDYPARRLALVGVRHLEDVFQDRRLSTVERTHPLVFAARWAWKRKFSVAGITLTCLLAAVVLILLAREADRNPSSASIGPRELVVYNRLGKVIHTESISEDTHEHMLGNSAGLSIVYDIEGDGHNEVCYGETSQSEGVPHQVRCYSPGTTGGLDWTFPLKIEGQRFARVGGTRHRFRPQHLGVLDPRGDGNPVVIVSAAHETMYPHVVFALDARSGRELARYIHSGFLFTMDLYDMDRDGKEEIFLGGVHHGSNLAGVVVLDPGFLSGQSPAHPDYFSPGLSPGLEKAYIRFPLTEYGERFRYLLSYRSVSQINFSESEFQVTFWEFHLADVAYADTTLSRSPFRNNEDSARLAVLRGEAGPWVRKIDSLLQRRVVRREQGILVHFDPEFRAINADSNSEYDMMVDFLVDHGMVESRPDSAYWQAYTKRIEYWDGDRWVTGKPALNRRYVEAVERSGDQPR